MFRQGALIDPDQTEGNDFVALRHLVGDEELPPSFPTPWCLQILLIKAILKVNENVSEFPVHINRSLVDSRSQDILDCD